MSKKVAIHRVWRYTLLALVASASLVVNPALAAGDSCLPTPALDSTHQSTNLSLGSGVTATAWTWAPGADAENSSLSPLGSKVSVIAGDLRNIDFGVLHWAIPQTQTLRDLSQESDLALGTLNGDYFDGNGPWNAMIEDSQVSFSPAASTQVIGMTKHKVTPSKGYRGTGTLTIGTKKYLVTGVNQPAPGPESLVVYGALSATQVPAKGATTLVLKSGAIYKVYPKGAAVSIKLGTVIQARGAVAVALAKLKVKTKVKLSLVKAPLYETRMAADTITTTGTVSNNNTTLTFSSVNYPILPNSGASLFDENFAGAPPQGSATMRLGLSSRGIYWVKNLYSTGASVSIQPGEFIIQANGPSALSARKFKVGDHITFKAGYRAVAKNTFITAAGRGPRLVEGGKFIWICAQHNKDFRPRSAIGWNQDGKVWLVASSRGVDAADLGFRQGGSTADQMGHWLLSLGATDAVLLDGGGSTTMEIKNPDSGWQRLDVPDYAWYRELANGFSLQLKG